MYQRENWMNYKLSLCYMFHSEIPVTSEDRVSQPLLCNLSLLLPSFEKAPWEENLVFIYTYLMLGDMNKTTGKKLIAVTEWSSDRCIFPYQGFSFDLFPCHFEVFKRWKYLVLFEEWIKPEVLVGLWYHEILIIKNSSLYNY